MRAALMLTLLTACAATPDVGVAGERSGRSQPQTATVEIPWQAWSADAFAEASASGKMLLIDVGMEGCTACRWMDERTYADPRVAALVAEHFVAVSVDAEARPDIGERYEAWAWPATIFMRPDGRQVLALRGNKLPRNFLPILDQLIEHHAAGTLESDEVVVTPRTYDGPLETLRDVATKKLDRSFDAEIGGWGTFKHLPQARLHFAFFRAHARGETQWQDNALQTAAGMTKLIDPVWGGVFVAAKHGWSDPIPEKRIAGQAAAMMSFAAAFHSTADERWMHAANDVARYVQSTLTAEDGTFFTSQEDVAPRLPNGLDADAYYRLDDAARRAHGTPPVDHAIYTHKNAAMIRAYVALASATADPKALQRAIVAAEEIARVRQTEAGWFRQVTPTRELASDDRIRGLPEGERIYALPQGAMGLALLELFAATGDSTWLARARKLAVATRAALEDATGGGFYDTNDDSTDAVAPRLKSLEANALIGRFLYVLSVYEHDPSLAASAQQALRAVGHPKVLRREGSAVAEFGIFLDLVMTGAIEFSVVGAPNDPRAKALHAAAWNVYEPRKVLHFEAPGRYPDVGRPALVICSERACSSPITDPQAVVAAAKKFASD